MKNESKKKLVIKKDTLKELSEKELDSTVGGTTGQRCVASG